MVSTVLNFKGYIVFVMLLLLSQQSFAAFCPMNCDDMKDNSIVQKDNQSHVSSHMTAAMHQHNSKSQDKMSSHEKCGVCDSGDCQCIMIGLCLGSTHTAVSQQLHVHHVLFIDLGKRFIFSNESPHSGINIHPFRPPITL